MSESLTDLHATDVALDAIAARGVDASRDLVLAELSLFAAALDEVSLPPVGLPTSPPTMTSARKGGWALSVTVALMVTSSGVAAAVSDDPLGPLRYVTNQVWKLGPHTGGKLPGWELDGAMPISTLPAGAIPGAGVYRPTGASSGPTGGDGGAGVGYGGSGPTRTGQRGTGSGDDSGYGTEPPGSTGSGSGSGHGPSSGPRPPQGGKDPGNTHGGSGGSGSPTGPSRPSGPNEPVNPGHRGSHAGHPYHPGFGPVPGAGTGAPSCRVDHPGIPGDSSWTGNDPNLPPCQSDPTSPVPPATPAAAQLAATPPPSTPTGQAPAVATPTRPEGSGTRRSIP